MLLQTISPWEINDNLKRKTETSLNLTLAERYWKLPIFQNTNIAFPSNFQINTFPLWYTSVSAQIKLVISEISIVFEDIKISLGLCISARKDQAKLFKNRNIVFTTDIL